MEEIKSYQDKTFCPFYENCQIYYDGECDRALTNKVWRQAEKAQLPVVRFAEIPKCFQEARIVTT